MSFARWHRWTGRRRTMPNECGFAADFKHRAETARSTHKVVVGRHIKCYFHVSSIISVENEICPLLS